MEEKQYYSEKRISSSSLKYFEQSPLTFKKFLDQELDQEEKSYLTRGKQIHMAILEPKVFKANYTHLDFETPSSAQQKQFCDDYVKTSDLLLAYKNNYKTTVKDEKILELAKELKDKLSKYVEYLQKRKQFKDILSNTDWQRIKDLKEGCKIHKKANALVFNEDLDTRTFLNEFVIFWEHPSYKLPCKSMIDRMIIDHENKVVSLIDLKTANTFKDFKERCNEFGYFRQMAFYWMAINWYFVNELKLNFDEYTKETYIVALKTVDDPEVKVFKITEQQLKDGWLDLTEQMSLLAWHWENNKWEYTRSYYIGDGDEKL
jgi:hypothetical protein